MSVNVLFFASLREAVGCEAMTLELDSDGIDLAGLLQQLGKRLDAAAVSSLTAESVRIALNQELMSGAFRIKDGDEIAFLPPVTGG